MINSIAVKLGVFHIPPYTGQLSMSPFKLELPNSVHPKFKDIVAKMISFLPYTKGTAYLTVDGKTIKPGETHRRPGPHIDGNYILDGSWDNPTQPKPAPDWKVGGDGRNLTPEQHKASYQSITGGMLIISDYPGCRGWLGSYDGDPGTGGDCSHIALDKPFTLEPNVLYYGNSQFIHESIPLDKKIHRTLIRITLPHTMFGYTGLQNGMLY